MNGIANVTVYKTNKEKRSTRIIGNLIQTI